MFRYGGYGCSYGFLCSIRSFYNGFHSCWNGWGWEYRTVSETSERSFWCRILRVGRYDGGSCNDCGICTSYHCNNTGCYSGTVLVRYVGCAVGWAAFEDGYAMRFQFNSDWWVCFYYRIVGGVAPCDEWFSVSYCGGSFGYYHLSYSLYDSLCRAGFKFRWYSFAGKVEKLSVALLIRFTDYESWEPVEEVYFGFDANHYCLFHSEHCGCCVSFPLSCSVAFGAYTRNLGEAACCFPDYSVYCSILAGYYDKKESFGWICNFMEG